MKSIVFTFGEETSEEGQDQVRRQILELPGVHNVGRISPEARKPALRRLWYAEVADEKTASQLVTQLRAHDDIQSADVPAERKLT